MEDQHKREVIITNPKNQKKSSIDHSSSPTIYAPPSSSTTTTTNSDGSVSLLDNNYDEEDAYFDSFPAGYRFKPYDEELVAYYLKRKILNEPLPPNRIKEVELYKYNPDTLAANYKSNGEKEWYFFTPRDRKYPNGERPNRAAGDGYWKATGADKPVKFEGAKVGCRKALVFYRGKPPKGEKTDWIMHEYRVNDPPKRKRGVNDMKLDDWVLCRIYKKLDRAFKAPTRRRDQASENGINEHGNSTLLPIKETPIPTMTGIERYPNPLAATSYHLNGFPRVLKSFEPSFDLYNGSSGGYSLIQPTYLPLKLPSQSFKQELPSNEYHFGNLEEYELLGHQGLDNFDFSPTFENFEPYEHGSRTPYEHGSEGN